VASDGVAGHLSGVENVIEDNKIRRRIIIIKAKVGTHPAWVILYRAIRIDLDIVRERIKVTVNYTIVGGIRTIELVRLRGGGCAQQQREEDQKRDSEVGTTRPQNYADTIPVPYLPVRTYLSQLAQQRQRHKRHDQCIPKFGTGSLG